MIYPILAPPFKLGDFGTLTKKQAQQHFDWYVASIPERVKLLEELVRSVWDSRIQLDYSLDSLGPLWEEFESHIESKMIDEEESKAEKERLRAENAQIPDAMIESIVEGARELVLETRIIAMDVAMYFGEVVARNLPGIRWGFFVRRKLMSVNRPVLLGFASNLYMDPRRIVVVGCYRSLDNRNPQYLSEIVDVWRQYLPEQ